METCGEFISAPETEFAALTWQDTTVGVKAESLETIA
jgi:hypothetical protein